MKSARMKSVSVIMAVMLLVCTSPGAFAASLIDIPSQGEIFLQFDGHGQYTEVTSAVKTLITNDVNTNDIGCVVVATATDDEDLYYLSGNDYMLRVNAGSTEQNTFLRVGRNDIDVESYSSETLDEFNLPPALVSRISTIMDEQIAMGNEDFGVSVYLPVSSMDSNEIYSLQSEVSPQGSTESWEEYYTLAGHQFTDSYLKFWNYNCTYSDSSANASETASALVSFGLECIGVASETVSAFQFGYSALKTLAIALGVTEATAGSGYDAIQVLVTYDAIYRITYWNIPGGTGQDPYVATCKAWLNTNFTQQTHDDLPSGGYQTETFLNKTMVSPHYDDPASWLYYNYYDAAGIIEGPIYHTILDETFMLV